MKLQTLLISSIVAGLAIGSSAMAQGAAPAPAVQIRNGPAVPGVCVVSLDVILSGSKAGGFIKQRLEQLGAQITAELTPEQTAFGNDVKAFQAQQATLDQATAQARGQALEIRQQQLRDKADLRTREMKKTQDDAYNRVLQQVDPILNELYQAKNCSILLNRNAVFFLNPEMDLDGAVIAKLDTQLQQFPIERAHLDGPGAAAAPK